MAARLLLRNALQRLRPMANRPAASLSPFSSSSSFSSLAPLSSLAAQQSRLMRPLATVGAKGGLSALLAGSAAAAVALIAQCEDSDGVVVESSTGLSFPKKSTSTNGAAYSLVGVGCRKKFGLVAVYAFALSVGDDDIDTLVRNSSSGEDFLQGVLAGQTRCRLSLKFYRTVDKATLVSAIEDSVRPRLRNPEKAGLAWLSDTILDMVAQLGGSVTPGTELSFTWNETDGVLCIQLNDGGSLCLRSPDLAAALFDVYLGKDPISVDGRQNIIAGAELLRKTA